MKPKLGADLGDAMNGQEPHPPEHGHTFDTDRAVPGEGRTRWVVAITVMMMTAEIVAGTVYGSMALLADGWHMGTHAAALGIALFAYVFARRHSTDPRYSFGTARSVHWEALRARLGWPSSRSSCSSRAPLVSSTRSRSGSTRPSGWPS